VLRLVLLSVVSFLVFFFPVFSPQCTFTQELIFFGYSALEPTVRVAVVDRAGEFVRVSDRVFSIEFQHAIAGV
jgi:carotenoid cleavage dioxygenase-like enzyme